MKIAVKKESLIDWSISMDGKIIGSITKEFLMGKMSGAYSLGNSGAYTYNVKALGYVQGVRMSSFDYSWNVIRTFKEAKKLIVDYAKA